MGGGRGGQFIRDVELFDPWRGGRGGGGAEDSLLGMGNVDPWWGGGGGGQFIRDGEC